MKWTIYPLIGVNEIKFSMSPDDVENIFGKCKSQIDRSSGRVCYYYQDDRSPVLGFRDGKLVDITFGRWTEALYFDGVDYFNIPAKIFLDKVRLHDPDVKRDILGNVTSFGLGMVFDDSVPLGESDKTITLNSREQIREYLEFGPFTQA
jgi:hypothetical protein